VAYGEAYWAILYALGKEQIHFSALQMEYLSNIALQTVCINLGSLCLWMKKMICPPSIREKESGRLESLEECYFIYKMRLYLE
jgi:hypothetical protein